MVSYGRVELLSHELSLKYIQMKWHAYGKYINLAQLILYILYLTLLTLYASNIVDVNEKFDHNMSMVDDLHAETELPMLLRPNDSFVDSKLHPLSRMAERFFEVYRRLHLAPL